MINRQDLADGIRFAGRRAAAALEHVQDWDRQLAHEWTTADAFRHLAATAGALPGLYPLLGDASLSALGVPEIAESNAKTIAEMRATSRAALQRMILEGHEASAAYAATLDEADLATVITLGGYRMPKAEIVAQIWIHHAIAHAYEASARWPIP